MSPAQLSTDLQEKLEGKTVIYADRKYILLELDAMNWGILSVTRLERSKYYSSALLGYYASDLTALVELVKLRARSDLLEEINKQGFFTDLELLIHKYLRSIKKLSHAVVGESFPIENSQIKGYLEEEE